MAAAVVVKPRKVFLEDIQVDDGSLGAGDPVLVDVLGLGPTLLTPINFQTLSISASSYANDAAAQAAGLPPGRLYKTTGGVYRVRARDEVPFREAPDGVNLVFTVASTYEVIDVYKEGLKQYNGVDYTAVFAPGLVTVTFGANNVPQPTALMILIGLA